MDSDMGVWICAGVRSRSVRACERRLLLESRTPSSAVTVGGAPRRTSVHTDSSVAHLGRSSRESAGLCSSAWRVSGWRGPYAGVRRRPLNPTRKPSARRVEPGAHSTVRGARCGSGGAYWGSSEAAERQLGQSASRRVRAGSPAGRERGAVTTIFPSFPRTYAMLQQSTYRADRRCDYRMCY